MSIVSDKNLLFKLINILRVSLSEHFFKLNKHFFKLFEHLFKLFEHS